MSWRLWQLLRGKLRPSPASSDASEARRRRLEASYELEHARSRRAAVDAVIAASDSRYHVDEFAGLIQKAIQRK